MSRFNSMKCSNCNGTGKIFSRIAKELAPDDTTITNDICGVCNGTGVVEDDEDYEGDASFTMFLLKLFVAAILIAAFFLMQ